MVWGLPTHVHKASCCLGWNQVWEEKRGRPPSGCGPCMLTAGPTSATSWCPECIQPLHGCHGAHYVQESHDSSRRLEELGDEGESTGGNHPQVCPPTPSLPPHLCPLPALICHAPVAPPLSQNAPCTNPESDLYFMDELFVSWPYYPPLV